MAENRLRLLGILNIRSTKSLTHSLMNIGYKAIVRIAVFFVFISSSWYIIFEAKTFEEITQVFSIMMGIIVGLAMYIYLLYDKLNIIQLMNDLNLLVKQSEYKLIF